MSNYGATSSLASGGGSSSPEAPSGRFDGTESPEALRSTFGMMSFCFGWSHGLAATPLVVASSLLDKHLAFMGLCVLFLSAAVSSLFVTAPLVTWLSPRRALICGMLLYCAYSSGFAVALCSLNMRRLQDSIWILASAAGGLGGSLMWTAQGVYFSVIADELAAASEQPREAVTATLAGGFSFVFLTLEVIAKLTFSGLQALSISDVWIVTLYSILAFGAVILFKYTHAPACVAKIDGQPSLAASMLDNLRSNTSLFKDPVVWLLSPTNLAFGCTASFMNGTVNADMTAKELGKHYVAVFVTVTAITAAIAAPFLSAMAASFGRGVPITFGAACLLMIPVIITGLGCCSGWRWGILWLYIAQGVVRAEYESTNRATFADFFPEQVSGAFATCSFQSNLAFAAMFLLQSAATAQQMAWLLAVLAVAMPLAYAAARAARARA